MVFNQQIFIKDRCFQYILANSRRHLLNLESAFLFPTSFFSLSLTWYLTSDSVWARCFILFSWMRRGLRGWSLFREKMPWGVASLFGDRSGAFTGTLHSHVPYAWLTSCFGFSMWLHIAYLISPKIHDVGWVSVALCHSEETRA